jgi:hypothetical protein
LQSRQKLAFQDYFQKEVALPIVAAYSSRPSSEGGAFGSAEIPLKTQVFSKAYVYQVVWSLRAAGATFFHRNGCQAECRLYNAPPRLSYNSNMIPGPGGLGVT